MRYQPIPDLSHDSEPNGSSVLPLEQDLDSGVTSAVTAACKDACIKNRIRVFGTPGAGTTGERGEGESHWRAGACDCGRACICT